MNVVAQEACGKDGSGSYGFWLIKKAASLAGHRIDDEPRLASYDVELISLHHCLDLPRLRDMPRRAAIRIIGGHPLAANPYAALPFADAVFAGEGETRIADILASIEGGGLPSLSNTPGIALGDSKKVSPFFVPRLRAGEPYLNVAAEGHDPTWYIEIARGCPYSCSYCQLGCTRPYRVKPKRDVLSEIDMLDRRRSRKATLMAPDEASHPAYQELLDALHARGFQTMFGSMRIGSMTQRQLHVPPQMLIRVGIDGLSERLRTMVRKPITNAQIVEYFRAMSQHTNFKLFMIIGYPGETLDDWREWEQTMDIALTSERRVNGHLRIKWTPLIPQPGTPLEDADVEYPAAMARHVRDWHQRVATPWRTPGFFVKNDGLMGPRSWSTQVELTRRVR